MPYSEDITDVNPGHCCICEEYCCDEQYSEEFGHYFRLRTVVEKDGFGKEYIFCSNCFSKITIVKVNTSYITEKVAYPSSEEKKRKSSQEDNSGEDEEEDCMKTKESDLKKTKTSPIVSEFDEDTQTAD